MKFILIAADYITSSVSVLLCLKVLFGNRRSFTCWSVLLLVRNHCSSSCHSSEFFSGIFITVTLWLAVQATSLVSPELSICLYLNQWYFINYFSELIIVRLLTAKCKCRVSFLLLSLSLKKGMCFLKEN